MKNNKGQALVEFVIILPVLLLLIMSIVDFGNIILSKYSLENDIDVVYELYQDNNFESIEAYVENKNLKINYQVRDKFLIISLDKNLNILCPILKPILGNNYKVSVEKSMYEN